jgi:hypothetical protein
MVQMKGRLRRGLLRLWLVLSLGWIAGVGYHAYSVWPNNVGLSYAYRMLVGLAPNHLTEALGPPVGVLLVGLALWWVAAGFRK